MAVREHAPVSTDRQLLHQQHDAPIARKFGDRPALARRASLGLVGTQLRGRRVVLS